MSMARERRRRMTAEQRSRHAGVSPREPQHPAGGARAGRRGVACAAMTARTLARLQAYGRVALGGGLALAPGLVAGGWVGGAADRRDGQVLAVGLGARDVALALGTLRALSSGRGASAWLRAGIVADAGDLIGTLRARD